MKTRLFFKSLNTNLPPWASSLLSPSKTFISPNPISSQPISYTLNNVGDISHLLSLCGRQGHYHLGTSLHASIIKNPDCFFVSDDLRISVFIWNSVLSMYCKFGELCSAEKLFDRMLFRDTVSWNSMISGFLRNGQFLLGFSLFNRMLDVGVCKFDQATLTSILSACDEPEFGYVIKMIHCLVFLDGYEHEITVGNALITSYSKCDSISLGRKVFDEMYDKNVVTWTAVISGLVQNQFYEEGLSLFTKMRGGSVEPNYLTYLSSLIACAGLQAPKEGRQIHGLVLKVGIESELCVESALMDMYSKCGNMEEAWKIFDSAKEVDEVSMTVLLIGFAQNGYEEESIQFFLHLVNTGYMVDPNMVSAVLGVFGVGTSLSFGQQLHSLIIKRNFGLNPFVINGLINMYSKCGDLKESMKIFDRMVNKNSIGWNSMIAAFARHGNGLKAIELYEEMILQRVEPTDVTFLSLLQACSHVGLVEKGMEYLASMTKVHNIVPRMEHYASVVDMLGRARLLKEAKGFINQLPETPNTHIWQALLGACGVHGDTEMGKYAATELFVTAPESPMSYIQLANIYSSKGKWKERAKTIKRMKEMGVSRQTGVSWIEIDERVHSFAVEDRMHPKTEIIYDVLDELFGLMIDEGYVPDKKFIHHKMDINEYTSPHDSFSLSSVVYVDEGSSYISH